MLQEAALILTHEAAMAPDVLFLTVVSDIRDKNKQAEHS